MQTVKAMISAALIIGICALIAVRYGQEKSQPQNVLEEAQIQQKAAVLFSYDRSHPHLLPPNKLVALSVAIQFKDLAGAEKIMQSLPKVR